MKNKQIIVDIISNFGWWLYVKVAWNRNKPMQRLLIGSDVRENLGYYLREGHPNIIALASLDKPLTDKYGQ